MATKAQLMDRAAELNVTVEMLKGERISILAPKHMTFFSGFHEHAVWLSRGAWKMADAYQCLLDEMEVGPVPCKDPECEWCNDI